MGLALELLKDGFRKMDADDVDGFVAMQAADCEWSTPDGLLEGPEAVREYVQRWHDGFPGGVHTIERSYECGESTVVAEGTWRGTHTGALQTPAGPVPATGRDVSLRFCVVVEGDLAAREAKRVSLHMDQLSFLAQLGLIPEPAQA